MVSIHVKNKDLIPIKVFNMKIKGKLATGSLLWEDGNRWRGLATKWPTYSGNTRDRKKNVFEKDKP